MRFHPSPLQIVLLAMVAFAGLLALLRVAQSYEHRRLDEIASSPTTSIPNQVCAEDPQSCAAKTYFPPDGP